MKKLILLFSIFLGVINITFAQSVATAETTSIRNVNQEEFGYWLDSIVLFWMDSVTIPGMTISLIRGDSVLYKKGFGYIDMARTSEIDPDLTPFRIASISKVFTAICALQMVYEGKLDLHSDVGQYLDFEIKKKYDDPLTLHHLLTHTSGFDEVILGGGTRDRRLIPKLGDHLKDALPGQVRKPGEVFTYSNLGYALAGYLSEISSGQPMHQYAESLLLEPLDMSNTSFMRSAKSDEYEPKSYFRDDGEMKYYPPYELRRYPSGGMLSTADDMTKLMIMLLNDGVYKGKKILDQRVIESLWTEVSSNDKRLIGSRSYGFFNWNTNDVQFVNHGGSIEGFRSQFYLFPEHKIGLFISANSSWGGIVNGSISRAMREKWFYTKELAVDTAISTGMPQRANEIEGEYYTTRSPQTSVMKIGRLTSGTMNVKFDNEGYMYFDHDPNTRYAETDPLIYTTANHRTDIFSPIAFKEDDNGKIQYLFTSGFSSFYKLKWWERGNVQLFYAITIFCLLILGLVVSLISSRRRRVNATPPSANVSRFLRSANIASGLHIITFLTVGFYLYISDGLVFDFGFPWFLKLLLLLPLVAIILTIYSLFGINKVSGEKSISNWRKAFYFLSVLALIFIVPFLYYWNFLGFNY